MVQPFEEQEGILSVRSGYTGGYVPNPTYEEVCHKTTGHTEAVEIIFDPEIISFADLVEIYWAQTDPTDAFGQFEDRGDNYRPVIYYFDERQKKQKQRKTLCAKSTPGQSLMKGFFYGTSCPIEKRRTSMCGALRVCDQRR